MIDRNIRSTRSKDETRKAHRQAVITVVVLFILFWVVTRVQDMIMTPFKNGGAPAVGFFLAVFAGIAVTGAILYLVYRYGKRKRNG